MAKQDSGTDDLIAWLEGKKKAQEPPKPKPPSGRDPGEPVDNKPPPPSPAPPGEGPESTEKPEEGKKPDPPPAPRGVPTEPPPRPSAAAPEPPGPQPEPSPSPPPPESEDDKPPGVGGVLPKNVLAHFLLVDIGGEVKKTRVLPRYLPITKVRTLAGRYISAHIHLDDANTVHPKHAKIIYEKRGGEWRFVLYPLDQAQVLTDGLPTPMDGQALQSGDMVEIGSAVLIFFQKTLKGAGL